MTQRDLENITERMMRESSIGAELLRRYASYVVLNYKGLKEVYNRPLPEVVDRIRFQTRPLSEEERALAMLIEEAKKRETFSDRLLRLRNCQKLT